MKLSQVQLKLVQSSLWDAMDKNFAMSSEAIGKGEWDVLEYRRAQRLEIRELLETVRTELKK